jgi:hypothetical protein
VETVILSDEEAYRKKNYPTIYERIALQKDWAQEQLKDAKLAQEREALKKEMEDKILKEKRASGQLPPDPEGDQQRLLEEEKPIPVERDKLDEEEEDVAMAAVANISDSAYAEELKNVKERKLLNSRNTSIFHKSNTLYENRKLAFTIAFGFNKKEKDLTTVLPWLLLGRKETSKNLQSLLRMGVTHILNVTDDVPNSFPNYFLYENIKVSDSVDSDLGSHFETAVNFIKRVHDCEGRVSIKTLSY